MRWVSDSTEDEKIKIKQLKKANGHYTKTLMTYKKFQGSQRVKFKDLQ